MAARRLGPGRSSGETARPSPGRQEPRGRGPLKSSDLVRVQCYLSPEAARKLYVVEALRKAERLASRDRSQPRGDHLGEIVSEAILSHYSGVYAAEKTARPKLAAGTDAAAAEAADAGDGLTPTGTDGS